MNNSAFGIQHSRVHLFLAPHLDDAVLSCGGQIAQLTRQGEAVFVYTVFAADPPAAMPLSPILEDLYRRWQTGAQPVLERREEDHAALTRLGAVALHGPLADCVYRVAAGENATPQALYPSEASLWVNIHPADPALALLAQGPLLLPGAGALHVPLGAGQHVDHLLVRDWGRRLANSYPGLSVLYYEEYPYSTSSSAIEAARAAFAGPLLPRLHPLDEAAVAAKVAAIACYRSQISTFWPGLAAMDAATREYARQVGGDETVLAEREWQPAGAA